MKVGKAKIPGEDMDKEMGGEIDDGSAVEGDGRREHGKTLRKKERERGRRGR